MGCGESGLNCKSGNRRRPPTHGQELIIEKSMGRDKRLKDYKTQSAAARCGWGTKPKHVKKMKRHQRKKLRLANKEVTFETH